MDPLRTRDKGVCKWGGLRPHPPPTPRFFLTPCRLTSSIFAPAKTEPIWTLSEPVIKVFANGWGCAPPPPPQPPRFFFLTPCRLVFKNPEPMIKVFANGGGPPAPPTPRFFYTMQAGFQENRTHQQELRQTRSCYGVFLSHHTGSLFANEGFANGGGAAPSPTPRFLHAMQAGFQEPRTRDKGVCKWGGCAAYNFNPPPQLQLQQQHQQHHNSSNTNTNNNNTNTTTTWPGITFSPHVNTPLLHGQRHNHNHSHNNNNSDTTATICLTLSSLEHKEASQLWCA